MNHTHTLTTANEAGYICINQTIPFNKGDIGPPEAALQETSRVPCPPLMVPPPGAGIFDREIPVHNHFRQCAESFGRGL